MSLYLHIAMFLNKQPISDIKIIGALISVNAVLVFGVGCYIYAFVLFKTITTKVYIEV